MIDLSLMRRGQEAFVMVTCCRIYALACMTFYAIQYPCVIGLQQAEIGPDGLIKIGLLYSNLPAVAAGVKRLELQEGSSSHLLVFRVSFFWIVSTLLQ